MAVAAAVTCSPGFVREAFALKIFGIQLWGSDDDKENEVLNPVKFTVTLNTPGADSKLRDSLEKSSLLVTEPDKPASGDLGLLIRAKDDRDRLVAAFMRTRAMAASSRSPLPAGYRFHSARSDLQHLWACADRYRCDAGTGLHARHRTI